MPMMGVGNTFSTQATLSESPATTLTLPPSPYVASARQFPSSQSIQSPGLPDTSPSATVHPIGNQLLKQTLYTRTDSARIVKLLRMDTGRNDVLFYARQFIGVPYVAATLEVADPEKLVVNIRQLDCTTLVETVLALAMTKRQHSDSFEEYCRNLATLRYRNRKPEGYLSRLHYFDWWINTQTRSGLIEEVKNNRHFTAKRQTRNYYMSRNPSKYRMLKAHPEWVDSIASLEKEYNGVQWNYLPAASTGLSPRQLSVIRNGDLVAIVTRKAGLDYSHLGFAVWGKDGKLHLLNASSIHHQVVEEPKTLRQYLREHPTSIGIRLFRLK